MAIEPASFPIKHMLYVVPSYLGHNFREIYCSQSFPPIDAIQYPMFEQTHTGDGRNPAPPGMVESLSMMG